MGCNFCTSCLWVFLQLVSGIRGMAQQRDLFSDLLRTADYMKAFFSQRKNSEEELRLRLEQAEASLSDAQEDNEALRIELAEAKSREKSIYAHLHEAEDEMAQLKGKVSVDPQFCPSTLAFILLVSHPPIVRI